MKAKIELLPDVALQSIPVNAQQISKIVGGARELKIAGVYYDIARLSYDKGNVVALALPDLKEGSLILMVEHILSQTAKSKSHVPQPVMQALSVVFVQPSFSMTFDFSMEYINHNTSYFQTEYQGVFTRELPPPRTA